MPTKTATPASEETAPTPDQIPDVVPIFYGIRDRIIEFTRIRASELYENPFNFREHPSHQKAALLNALTEYGVTDVLKLYYSQRAGGKLTLLNGHLRRDIAPSFEWPCIITNLSDEEADKDLLFGDALSMLASLNGDMLSKLIAESKPVKAESAGLQNLLEQTKASAGIGKAAAPERASRATHTSTETETRQAPDLGERAFWPVLSFAVPIPIQRAWQAHLSTTGLEPHVALERLLASPPAPVAAVEEQGA